MFIVFSNFKKKKTSCVQILYPPENRDSAIAEFSAIIIKFRRLCGPPLDLKTPALFPQNVHMSAVNTRYMRASPDVTISAENRIFSSKVWRKKKLCMLFTEPSRDRVTTLPFTPMESSPLHRLLLHGDSEWGQAEVRECIGVYGSALVHEPCDRAVA